MNSFVKHMFILLALITSACCFGEEVSPKQILEQTEQPYRIGNLQGQGTVVSNVEMDTER